MRMLPEGADRIIADRKNGKNPEWLFIEVKKLVSGVEYDFRYLARLEQVVFAGTITDELMAHIESMFKQLKGNQPKMVHVWDGEHGGVQCWYLPDDVENCDDWTLSFMPWTATQNNYFRSDKNAVH